MTYQVFWKVPEQILCLELDGGLDVDHFIEIDRAILDHLGDETLNRRIALLIDITRPSQVPQAFAQLKASQTYVGRKDLKFILVAGSNKLLRLMILLIFNLCRPSLVFFDDVNDALQFYQKKAMRV